MRQFIIMVSVGVILSCQGNNSSQLSTEPPSDLGGSDDLDPSFSLDMLTPPDDIGAADDSDEPGDVSDVEPVEDGTALADITRDARLSDRETELDLHSPEAGEVEDEAAADMPDSPELTADVTTDAGADLPSDSIETTPEYDYLSWVVQTWPRPHEMVMPASDITIEFDRPIEPSSIHSQSLVVYGRWSGVIQGDFEVSEHMVEFRPTTSLSAGEWVTVSLSKSVQSVEGDLMPYAHGFNYWTIAGEGALEQELVEIIEVRNPDEGWIQVYGAYGGDLNRDGIHDLTIVQENSDDIRVYLGDGEGSFDYHDIYPMQTDGAPSTNAGFDYNLDGFVDFAVGEMDRNQMTVFHGVGDGSFSGQSTYSSGDNVRGLCTLDLNGDNYFDIVTANRSSGNITVFMNDGTGHFSSGFDIETGTSSETACAPADINDDGLMDLFVGAYGSDEVVAMLSDGDGGLSAAEEIEIGGVVWMLTAGDYNGDSHVDVVSVNSYSETFGVAFGDGEGGFMGVRVFDAASYPLAVDGGDLDGDGDLDIVTSNYWSGDFWVFENDGMGRFEAVDLLQGEEAGSCTLLHDRDLDGDLDITAFDELADLIFLYENPE